MKLSVIIPIFKVERYIRQTLESIFATDFANYDYEVIAVNDGTPDNAMSIVAEFAEEHSNLHIINQENQGQSVARNEGLKIAKGEYIWFFDSDDWMTEDAIPRAFELIEKNPEIEVFATPVIWKHASGDVNDWEVDADFLCTGIEYLKKGLYASPPQRFIIKRSFLDRHNLRFYPGIFHEDELFGEEFLYLVENVYFHHIPWCNYRQHDESVMHTITIRNAYNYITVHQQLMEFMKDRVKEEERIWWQKRAIHRIEEATSCVWSSRHSQEFKKFLADTKEYRECQCDSCAQLGDWRWKLKCWMLKHPIMNKYRRESINYLKGNQHG